MGRPTEFILSRRMTAEERVAVRAFAQQLVSDVLSGSGLAIMVAGDRKLRELNLAFLGHDYATDVLSFPEPEEGWVGELAISLDRAAAQAEEHGHTRLEELKILLLHGALHLAGHDHETDRGQMRRLESRLRTRYSLPSGLIERTRR